MLSEEPYPAGSGDLGRLSPFSNSRSLRPIRAAILGALGICPGPGPGPGPVQSSHPVTTYCSPAIFFYSS